jgi:hypothetical protein
VVKFALDLIAQFRKTTMFKKMLVAALVAITAWTISAVPAQAGVRLCFGIGLPIFVAPPPPRPIYVAPAPVYVQPAPIYVQRAAPVYVQPGPAPVYVQPAPAPVYVQPAPR